MIFETHAHYDDKAFEKDRDTLLMEINKSGVERVINVAANLEGCKDSLELSHKYDFVYCSIGVHPSDTAGLKAEDLAWMEEICRQQSVKSGGKVAAVGEIGLDYYWKEPDAQLQKKWFALQLEMASRVKLPVIIHSREAAKDTLDMMQSLHAEQIGGIIHCYSYSVEMAREYLNMGFYFGIGGVVTFQNAKKLLEVVEYLPLDRIVLETDSPYLAPVPNRGKRNSSLNLPYVVNKIAQIKGVSKEKVMEETTENAYQVYGLERK